MNTLCKSERLCTTSLFEELFASNFSFVTYPFRVLVRESSQKGEYPARIGISVSKKKFKRAVKRNRIKRLTREAYRCHKVLLYEKIGTGATFDILFIYLDNQMPAFPKVEKAICKGLEKIVQHLTSQKLPD